MIARKVLEIFNESACMGVKEIISKAKEVLENPKYSDEFSKLLAELLDMVEKEEYSMIDIVTDEIIDGFWRGKVTDPETWDKLVEEVLAGPGYDEWQAFIDEVTRAVAEKLGGKYPELAEKWINMH